MAKKALITGASSGIGYALADEFAKNGYDLILISHDEQKLSEAQEKLKAKHAASTIETICKDLTDENAPQEVYDQTVGKGMTIDVLINDAGVGKRGLFNDVALEDYIRIIRLDIEALTRMTKLFLKDMVARHDGKILNLGSIAGFQPAPLMSVYHASKAYVVSLSEALGNELKDTGVTLTCLCPGPVDTNFFQTADMEDAKMVKLAAKPEDIAAEGYRALMDGETIYIPGAMNKVLTFTRRLIPHEMQATVNKKQYESSAE